MVPTWVAILGGQIISNKIHYNYSIIYIYIYIYFPLYSHYIKLYHSISHCWFLPPFSHLGEVHAKQVVTHLPHLVQTCHQVLARDWSLGIPWREIDNLGPPGPTSADLVFPRSWRQFEVLGVSLPGIHKKTLGGTSKNGWNWMWYVNHQSNFATWGLKPDPKKVVDYWVTSWYVTSFQIALQDTFRGGPCRSRLKCHIDNHQNRRPKKTEQSSWSHDLCPK